MTPGCTFKDLTGKIFADLTGKASSATTGVSITITAGAPAIFIDSPLNQTYAIRRIGLNFSIENNNYFNAWYNLNGKNSNVTVTANTTFDGIYGNNTLTFYANNSIGQLNSSTVNFYVNKTLNFTYSKFNLSTSNLSNLSLFEGELHNLSNFTLQTSRGKIAFTPNVNFSSDADLDTYVNISQNFIFLNSTNLSNLNLSATLTFQNLTFTNPRPLRDGAVCPASICTEVSYLGGTYILTMTSFSSYSSEETPTGGQQESSPQGSGGGGSGGSGGETIKTQRFDIDEKVLEVSVAQGDTAKASFTIKNIASQSIDVHVDLSDLEEFLILPLGESTTDFTLGKGEEKTIPLFFSIAEDQVPNLYAKKISVTSGSQRKDIPVLIEIESSTPLFDVNLEILEEFSEVKPSEDLLAQVTIFNLGSDKGRFDVNVTFIVEDLAGKTIAEEKETLSVETQTTFVKRFPIPNDIQPGTYVFYVRVQSGESIGSSKALFVVSGVAPVKLGAAELLLPLRDLFYLLLVFFVLVVYIIYTQSKFLRETTKKHKKVSEYHLLKFGSIRKPKKEKREEKKNDKDIYAEDFG